MRPRMLVKKLRADAQVPEYKSNGAAGMDLVAAIDAPIELAPGARAAVGTGLAVAIPDGWEGQVRARSGRAREEGLALVNAPGTIDSDYSGEVTVLVINLGQAPIVIRPKERIAQLVIAPVARVAVEVVEELPGTARGAGGFGSTGR
ncbi:MAG TPA: dUTP diphosphatase [Kofleriaceae bacterium]|nr:dUTP diphosphatase [Kofleriaceae bacterium]